MTFAGNCPAPSQPRAEQVAQRLDEFAAGAVLATTGNLAGVLAHHRRALAAGDELRARAPATTRTVTPELGARREPA
jgi:hypothetical protein